MSSSGPGWHATTILMVRKGGKSCSAATAGQPGPDHHQGQRPKGAPARKGDVIAGFAGCHRRRLHAVRAARGQARAISGATDPRLRRTGEGLAHGPLSAPAGGDDAGRRQAGRARADRHGRCSRAGSERDGSVVAIGSGGNYALAAARALMPTEMDAESDRAPRRWRSPPKSASTRTRTLSIEIDERSA